MATFKGIITADGQKRLLSYLDLADKPEADSALTTEGGFADAKTVGHKFTETTANMGKLEQQIGELSKGGAGGTASPSEVKKIVDEYLKENPKNFLPDNIVLVEESDDEIMTADAIMGEILDKLELKTVNDQTLGLYIGTKLISSVKLEEFKTSEIICTGITLDPSNTTAYGKATIEVIATATPQDCTQKIRWFTTDADLATVSDGTVKTTGKKGEVTIYAICGNYRAECKIVITAYTYPEFNFQIGELLTTVGAVYTRTADSQKKRISSDYIETPVNSTISMTAGTGYLYSLFLYKDKKLAIEASSWKNCVGVIDINSEEYSGFALKVRQKNYEEWTEEEIEAFTKTVTIESA